MNAFLAVSILPFPIETFDDVMDLDLGITFFKGGIIDEILSRSKHGTAEKQAHDKYMAEGSAALATYKEGIDKVIAGTHVFLQKLETMKAHPTYPCQIVDVKGFKIIQGIVFPMRKDHPLLPAFNREILKLKESGILHKLQTKYISAGETKCDEESGDSLGFENVLSPFFILSCGVCASILIAILEVICHKGKKQNSSLDSGSSGIRMREDSSADLHSAALTLAIVREVVNADEISDHGKIKSLKAILQKSFIER